MENKKILNIKKAAHNAASILDVIRGILIVAIILCGMMAICCFVFRLSPDGESVSIFGKTITLHSPVSAFDELNAKGFEFIEKLNIESVTDKAAINCIVAMAMVAVVLAAITIIRNLFKKIKESDTPFTEEIAKQIKITGIVVSILVLTESLGIAAIVALSFWCFSCIFEYGTELQQHEDETL